MDFLDDFKKQGYTRFLVTNIDHDGVMSGPDTETYARISDKAKIIASVGVSSIQDIKALTKTGVESVVVGKALYLEKFTLKEAMEAARC